LTTRGAVGIINNSFDFNGVNNYVSDVYQIPYANFSQSLWINLDTVSTTQTFYSARNTGDSNPVNDIKRDSTNQKIEFNLRDNGGGGLTQAISTTIPLAGVWYNLVRTFNVHTGEMKLYINVMPIL